MGLPIGGKENKSSPPRPNKTCMESPLSIVQVDMDCPLSTPNIAWKKKTSPPTSHHPTQAKSCSVRLSVKGWCAANNLEASRVSIRMDNWTDSGEASFNIPTSFNSFIHPVIRSYCPSGFRGSFILLSVRLQGRLHSSFNIYSSTGNGQWLEESSRHYPHRQTPLLL